MKTKQIIIAGPCAAESAEQVQASIDHAQQRGIDFLRASLWKPRTKPGFEGLQNEGIPLLVKVAQSGLNPATEVIMPDHAKKIIKSVLAATRSGKLLIWIGSRNQNHYLQQEIAKIAASHERVFLMVKNQPWLSEDHWEGIIEHVLGSGMPKERLLVCHRGFAPSGDNPLGLRNLPDFEMAMRVKKKTGLPMLFDPSHIGGSIEKVLAISYLSLQYQFDGLITEVHPNPAQAKTDAGQQLTWKQFDSILSHLHILAPKALSINV